MAKNLCNYKLVRSLLSFNFVQTLNFSLSFRTNAKCTNYTQPVITCSNNNRSNGTNFERCSKLTTKTPEGRHCHRSGVFIVNSEHISHLVLVFLLLTLSR